jgi:hypothetical protein
MEPHTVVRRRDLTFSKYLTDGDEVSLTRRPSFTPQADLWYSFLLEA